MSPNEASIVIQRLGGTTKTATLCEVSPQAVSQWRENGLPRAQRKFLLAVRPEVFDKVDEHAIQSESQPQ